MRRAIDSFPVSSDEKCFRPRRYYFNVGVGSVVFCAVIGAISTAAAYWNVDGSFEHPERSALLFGGFWSGFVLLGVWLILTYYREQLCLSGERMVQHGVVRVRVIDLDRVVRIVWRIRPIGGSIVVRSDVEKIIIHLDNFTIEEREEVIRFMRERFADEVQEDWTRFVEYIRRPVPPKKPMSRGAIVVSAVVLTCFSALFIYGWFAGLGAQCLILGLVTAIAAIGCLVAAALRRSTKESREGSSSLPARSDL